MKKVFFIHFKKCGGMSIATELEKKYELTRNNEFLKKNFNKNMYSHIVGNIRNPYKYYVSAYRWGKTSRGKVLEPLDENYKNEVSNAINEYRKKNNIDETIKLTKDQKKLVEFKIWMKYILTNKNKLKSSKNCDLSQIMKDYNIGLVTARFLCYYYRDFKEFNKPDPYFKKYLKDINSKSPYISNFIKVETIRDDLKRLKIDYSNTWSNQKINNESELQYYHYYDQDLIDLIYKRYKYIFDKFNYNKLYFRSFE